MKLSGNYRSWGWRAEGFEYTKNNLLDIAAWWCSHPLTPSQVCMCVCVCVFVCIAVVVVILIVIILVSFYIIITGCSSVDVYYLCGG